MSLLMDALKKAELAKRQGQGEIPGGAGDVPAKGGLMLEPIPQADPVQPATSEPVAENGSNPGSLPHLPSHLEELDAQFLAEAKQAASTRLRAPPIAAREPLVEPIAAAADAPVRAADAPKSRPGASRQNEPQQLAAAQNLFSSKQPDKPQGRKGFAIAVGALTVLSASGIGGYFWWQLQPKTSLVASRMSPSPAATAPISAPATVSPSPTAAAPLAAPQLPPVSGTGRPTGQANDDRDDDAVATRVAGQTRRASAAAPIETEGPIRVSKAPLKINPALMRGFEAFNRGDLAVAQTEYEKAQKSDPLNTDALHGLAAIAVRQSRLDQAESLYRRIVEADPHDTVAMSALINMRRQVDPGMAESRLKTLSADQPELAAPHFSLGNLYARHGRWNEAQQEYFRAYSAEPDNPDIIYNLAISLEHLRQNKLAAQYYAEAIAAAQNRTAGFDKAQAAARLRTLQP